MNNKHLLDTVDLSGFEKFIGACFHLTGIRTALIRVDDEASLLPSDLETICPHFSLSCTKKHQQHVDDSCCNIELFDDKQTRLHHCRCGLILISTPVILRDIHTATLLTGYFCDPKIRPDIQSLRARYGCDARITPALLDSLPVLEKDDVCFIESLSSSQACFLSELVLQTQNLKEMEEILRVLLDNTRHFLGLLSVEGTLLFANYSALDYIQETTESVIGRPFWETPWWRHSQRLQKKVRESIECAAKGEIVQFETTHPNRDNSLEFFDFSIMPVRNSEGRIIFLIPEGIPITDQRESSTSARKKVDLLQQVIDAIPHGIVYKDLNGTYLGCNDTFCRWRNVKRDEVLGKTSYDFFPREIADEHTRTDAKLNSSPGAFTYEGQMKYPDGSIHDILFHKETFYDRDGKSRGIVGTSMDVTELKHAEAEKQALKEQLTQAQKLESIGRLAGGVAHDFNNMLGVILGNAELAALKIPEDSPLARHLEEIKKAARHSSELTKQLLAFARKQTVAPRVLDLNETITGILKMLRHLVGEQIHLTCNQFENLWHTEIDPSQVKQILVNLVTNSRDSIIGTGTISIETNNISADELFCKTHGDITQGDYVSILISDDGAGIAKDCLDNIFEPFFTTKQQGKGTGLGLATVYGIVKQNRGSVHVYSEEGMGTTFKILLPRYLGNAQITETQKSTDSITSGGTESILLVEDEVMFLELTKQRLQDLGYTVISATTPKEAMAIAEDYRDEIDLLVTDIIMPDMNGQHLAEHISAIRPDIRKLFMSGYTADIIARHGVLEEGIHFLTKPFSMNELAGKVREALT